MGMYQNVIHCKANYQNASWRSKWRGCPKALFLIIKTFVLKATMLKYET